MSVVDLTTLVVSKDMYRVLIGYENGVAARAAFDLNRIDGQGDPVDVISQSEKVKSISIITPQFIDGLFRDSLEHAGSIEAFRERFTFVGEKFVTSKLERGIAHSWLFTSEGSKLRLASERASLEGCKKAYPIEMHPWMTTYIARQEAYIRTIEADIGV